MQGSVNFQFFITPQANFFLTDLYPQGCIAYLSMLDHKKQNTSLPDASGRGSLPILEEILSVVGDCRFGGPIHIVSLGYQ